MTNIATANEAAVLRSIATNSYTDANYRSPAKHDHSEVWTNLINDAGMPSGITGKSLSGTISSLNKKKFANSFEDGADSTVLMTVAGWDAMIAFYGSWNECFGANPKGAV